MFTLVNDDDCRALWASVLVQAIKDLDGKYSTDRKLAYHYIFLEPDRGAGSFLWVCGVLGLEPDALRTIVMTRAGRARIKDKNRPRPYRKKQEPITGGEHDYD
jgi:hypothetical protein